MGVKGGRFTVSRPREPAFLASLTGLQRAVTAIRTGVFDGVSEENAPTLRISLGGASALSALTGHRQDARLVVRVDAAHCAASFQFPVRSQDGISEENG